MNLEQQKSLAAAAVAAAAKGTSNTSSSNTSMPGLIQAHGHSATSNTTTGNTYQLASLLAMDDCGVGGGGGSGQVGHSSSRSTSAVHHHQKLLNKIVKILKVNDLFEEYRKIVYSLQIACTCKQARPFLDELNKLESKYKDLIYDSKPSSYGSFASNKTDFPPEECHKPVTTISAAKAFLTNGVSSNNNNNPGTSSASPVKYLPIKTNIKTIVDGNSQACISLVDANGTVQVLPAGLAESVVKQEQQKAKAALTAAVAAAAAAQQKQTKHTSKQEVASDHNNNNQQQTHHQQSAAAEEVSLIVEDVLDEDDDAEEMDIEEHMVLSDYVEKDNKTGRITKEKDPESDFILGKCSTLTERISKLIVLCFRNSHSKHGHQRNHLLRVHYRQEVWLPSP